MQGITVTLEELLSLRHVAQQLHLPMAKMSRNIHPGINQSSLRGRGMDFVENRAYLPGDDIRAINWAVTARTGKTHTKIYQQERDRSIYLIMDFNESMFFGTRTAFKSVIASQVAALIAWTALRNKDRIGAVLVKENTQLLQPTHSKQNIIELLKKIAQLSSPDSAGTVDIKSGLTKLKRTIKSGSLIYFLSDFYCLNEEIKNDLFYLSKHHEIINVFIYDPLERTPPPKGRYLFHERRHANSLLMDTSDKTICQKYSDIFNNRLFDLKKISFATGMHIIELATNQDIIKSLRQILNRKLI